MARYLVLDIGGTAASKQSLREELRAARAAIPATQRAQADAQITQNVMALPAWKDAQLLLTYLSIGTEVETRTLIEAAWAADKSVALPRCIPHKRQMVWQLVHDFDALIPSSLGVLEPAASTTSALDPAALGTLTPALALVPGLAFDSQGFRIGYGGGYYDNFLASFTGFSLGLCREALLLASLQSKGALESHDLPVSGVATELSVRFSPVSGK